MAAADEFATRSARANSFDEKPRSCSPVLLLPRAWRTVSRGWALAPGRPPRLGLERITVLAAVTDNMACHSGRDRDWHRAVLARCPSLRAGFEPSLWVRNAHVQNA